MTMYAMFDAVTIAIPSTSTGRPFAASSAESARTSAKVFSGSGAAQAIDRHGSMQSRRIMFPGTKHKSRNLEISHLAGGEPACAALLSVALMGRMAVLTIFGSFIYYVFT